MPTFLTSNIVKQIWIYLLCIIALIWAIGPIYWIFVSSISTRIELYATPIKSWFPSEPTWDAYSRLFQGGGKYRGGDVSPTEGLMWSSLYNTLIVSIISAAFVTGYFSIEFLLRVIRNHGTFIFVIYRIVIGTGILIFLV